MQILETMKLDLEEFHRTADNQLDIMAKNPAPFTGGEYLIQCLYVPSDYVVDAAKILELSNSIIQDRLSKGIFITTGKFTPDLSTISELAPIEFIDGEQFRNLVKEHAPDYWVILS
ncbi:MAG: restriction endonuclease [Deltaproteobacteria bacterium]|nr:MAG: restriction endonuclease [Deltaproteobacteria bacterium]